MAARRSLRGIFVLILVGLVLPDFLVSYVLRCAYLVLRFFKNDALYGYFNDLFQIKTSNFSTRASF